MRILLRILLADDQPVVRYALRVLLERQPGLVVVGEAGDAASLLREAESKSPDLVLLDWPLPGALPEEAVSALRQVCPQVPIVALSGRPEAGETALNSGADSFVCKCDPPEVLLAAIRGCHRPPQPSSNGSPPSLRPMLQSAA